jgi:SAM-dependent methyltransferase
MDEWIAANRANWDDRTAVHLESAYYDVDGWLHERPGPRAREVEALGAVTGLRLVHLQCHFGLDTLAWADAGATVTGLDFSPAAIDAARDLARRAGLDGRATFVCADVHDAVAALGRAAFDVVYVSLGALCWLPRVDRWAEQVAGLLVPGGRLYLHDVHPLAWALGDDEPLQIQHAYFEEPDDPYSDDDGRTYTDGERRLAHARHYQWNHGIGEIVTALLRHGLTLDALAEHDWTVWPRYPWLRPTDSPDGDRFAIPPGRPRMPLSFTLLASRRG